MKTQTDSLDMLYTVESCFTSVLKSRQDKSIPVEWELPPILEVVNAIYHQTRSVPELLFIKDLYELLCQNGYRPHTGFGNDEEYKELLDSGTFENGELLEIFINSEEIFEKGKIIPDVAFRKGVGNWIIFEIDSFQYHSNQDQLRKDKIRERKIQSLGYPVFRFSAKEVLDGSWGTAIEAYKVLDKRGFLK